MKDLCSSVIKVVSHSFGIGGWIARRSAWLGARQRTLQSSPVLNFKKCPLSFHVLPMQVWVFSGFPGFLPQTKIMDITNLEIFLGASKCVNVSLCVDCNGLMLPILAQWPLEIGTSSLGTQKGTSRQRQWTDGPTLPSFISKVNSRRFHSKCT